MSRGSVVVKEKEIFVYFDFKLTQSQNELGLQTVCTDDSRLLQESNYLTAMQPRRAPHHVIHLI